MDPDSLDTIGLTTLKGVLKPNEAFSAHPKTDLNSNASSELLVTFGVQTCLLYTSPSPRDTERSRMPSSA